MCVPSVRVNCSHILLVTHEETKCKPKTERKPMYNLHHMVSQIAGGKKVGKNKAGKKPKTVKHCLLPEDSDDDDDSAPAQLTW